ncbi:hypothetical protein [Acidocella sp. KAb 2-4]|uniref:hypothetical protein n=1 Tax=Acidocella sp. KAb 2-4 TaxID=2885158 RepID=UPI001D065CA4|nr:hypothetical protein [Acidocella sp. KAb 2-4]MCB5944262.1 hypothetical protein [Acidocella sp. KAb 2-4]
MSQLDQKICAWGGPFCAATFGAGLLMAGFVPPPSPNLDAAHIAAIYQAKAGLIRVGMILSLFGITGYTALIGAISAQLWRISGISRLGPYLQLGAGAIGVLTVMFPTMIFAIAAFRPERDPNLTQLLNDAGWLIIIPAFPTFIAQFGGIAAAVLQDQAPMPIFPRWCAFFNIWVAILFIPGGFSYCFRTGPFAWNGLLAFWGAASAFFVWLLVMTWLTLHAIQNELKISS